MKRPLGLVLILLMVAVPGYSESIKKVVLYQDMAYITLEKTVQDHMVSVDAPPDIILDSVTISPKAGGSVSGLEIEPWRSMSGKVKQLQDQLTQKKNQLEAKKRLQATIEKEIEIIYTAAQATRKENAFPRQRMVEALAFIDERVNTLNAKSIRVGQEVVDLGTQIKDLEEQLNKLSQRQGYRITAKAEGVVSIGYAVRNAYWKPEYSVAAVPGKNGLTLEIAARMWQSTGLDWEAEEVLVSTGRPSFGIQAPEIHPWYVAFPRPARRMIKAEAAMMAAAPMMADEEVAGAAPEVKATTTSYFIGVARGVNLPGDGTVRTARLQKAALSPSFTRVCVPKFNQAVYLRCESLWDGSSPIIPGDYTAFVDGEYCGKGMLLGVQPGEKLSVDLGRDEGLKVKRQEERFHEKTLTGKDKTTYSITITLENTRREAVKVSLKDQIPVSQDEKVTVELTAANPKVMPDKDGILSWEAACPANTKTTVTFSFVVTGMVPEQIW